MIHTTVPDCYRSRFFVHDVEGDIVRAACARFGVKHPPASVRTFRACYRYTRKALTLSHVSFLRYDGSASHVVLPPYAAAALTTPAQMAELLAEAVRWGRIMAGVAREKPGVEARKQ